MMARHHKWKLIAPPLTANGFCCSLSPLPCSCLSVAENFSKPATIEIEGYKKARLPFRSRTFSISRA